MCYCGMDDCILYCGKCKRDRIEDRKGVYVCGKCGETTYGYATEYIPNIWLYQKSKHSRRRWFAKLAQKHVRDYTNESVLTADFLLVVRMMDEHNLLEGRNISKYSYYLIRLASRRGIELKKRTWDIKNSGAKVKFDDRLFGVIYPLLGWDVDCECPYYLEWVKLVFHFLKEA